MACFSTQSMASKSSSSTSGGSSAGSDEEDFGGDLAERYCEAITKLTPAIVAVLKNEIEIVLPKAFAKGLIGDGMYNTGITLQSDPQQQASQLLSMVKAQIKFKLSFYVTFLDILRSTTAPLGTWLTGLHRRQTRLHRKWLTSRRRKRRGKRSGIVREIGNVLTAPVPPLALGHMGILVGVVKGTTRRGTRDFRASPSPRRLLLAATWQKRR